MNTQTTEDLYLGLPRALQIIVDFYQDFPDVKVSEEDQLRTLNMISQAWEAVQYGGMPTNEEITLWQQTLYKVIEKEGTTFLDNNRITIQMVCNSALAKLPLYVGKERVLEPRDLYINRYLKMHKATSAH